MRHRVPNRGVVFISLLVTMLCIALTAFAFSLHASASSSAASSSISYHSISSYRHRKPTPGITPTTTRRPKPTPTTAITSTPTPGITPTIGVTRTPTTGTTPTPLPQTVRIFVEPDVGEQVILDAINGAQKSIWLEMYLLTDKNIIQALENAAGRHLDVRVMLEPHPYGGGSPQSTLDALQAAGASVEDTSSAFTLTHEKGMIIDGNTAFIMTCNFTYSALNGKNREYGIIDTTPQDVQGTIDIFNADWNRTSVQVTDPNLVVSPNNSRPMLTNLINSAKTSLILEEEEMQDSSMEEALVNAERRGVAVQVILAAPSGSSNDPNGPGIAVLKAGGVQVKEDTQLYIHAKMIVADGNLAFVGSENFSTTSLDNNRELGVLLTNAQIMSTLQQTFQSDWAVSQSMSWGY
jgi:cardiolipin synthase A/B